MSLNAQPPHSSGPEVLETHISWVFLTPDRAFKLLKPVAMPFLDHRDVESRLAAVSREVELNRRIAPDVYLGTADVSEDGELVDRMIVMRRLPASRRLSSLVADERFPRFLRDIARKVAAFHAAQEPVCPAPMASRDALRRKWADNFLAIAPLVDTVIDQVDHERVKALSDAYLTGREPLFDRRVADGYVRDGHGDLIADDIYCLDDGPRIIDCLSFNDDWRIGDVLADIGFLVMDIERLAGQGHAQELMGWYQQFSNEHHPQSLAHHYVAYRAHVRAKVACLRHAQGDESSAALARRYHEVALNHLELGRVRLVLVGGGPGVGKTSLANGIGDHFNIPVLSTDEIRKDITGTPHDQHRFAEPGAGIYEAEVTDRAYGAQRREAGLLLDDGHGVVLDGSFNSERHRSLARELAALHGAELVEIECRVDANVARDRIARRLSESGNSSDATPDLVDYMARAHDPWPSAIEVSTLASPDLVTAETVQAIERLPVRARRA